MKRFILLLCLIIGISGLSKAQLGGLLNKAKQQAERSLNKRAEKEVEKKVDEAVNKGIDKVFDDAEKSLADSTKTAEEKQESTEEHYERRLSGLMQSMGVGVDVPHKEQYVFSAKLEMLLEHTNRDGKQDDPMTYHSYFDKGTPDYAINFVNEDGQQSYFIFDSENHCSLILSDAGSEKTGIATNIKQEDLKNWVDEDELEKVDNMNFKKTGRRKTINGFSCEEYSYENEDGTALLWVTDELKNKINRSLYKSTIFAGSLWMANQTDGVMIQYDYTSKSSKERTLMTVQSVSFNSDNKIDTRPYKIMGLNVGQ